MSFVDEKILAAVEPVPEDVTVRRDIVVVFISLIIDISKAIPEERNV